MLVPAVLQGLHDGARGGHLDQHNTRPNVRCRFYWPRWTDVQEWCLRCPECAKTESSTACAHLNPSQVGYPTEMVALDIFRPLPQTSQGNWYILVITDYFTRRVEAFPMPSQEAPTIAKVLVKEWICRYGAPDSIHSDQGKNFESHLFSEICHLLGIHKTRTTPYHPQSDELVERFNHTLWTMLAVRMGQVPEDTQDDELPMLTMAYRSIAQESTKSTLFQLMFGHEIQLPIDVIYGGGPAPWETHSDYVSHLKQRMEDAYNNVRENVHGAQKHRKQHYDSKTVGGRYSIGDMVFQKAIQLNLISRGRARLR